MFVGGVILLAGVIWGGLSGMHRWQEHHLVRRAAAFLSGGDFQTASLNARRALQLNEQSAEAARIMAQVAEHAADGSELDWRRKVAELQPASLPDAIAVVRAQLRSNQLGAAEKTLRGLSAMGERTALYHAAWARLSEMQKHREDAEAHWTKAISLEPANTAFQMQLASLQLASGEPAKRAGAIVALEKLRADRSQRAAATRALVIDRAAHRFDPQAILQLARELQSYPEKTFADRLLYAEILRQLHEPTYADVLSELERDAGANAPDVASLLSWMNGSGQSADAAKYTTTLPAEVLSKWPVPMAAADAYANSSDWDALQRMSGAGEWTGGAEFLRHTYLARAARAEHDELAATREWAQAQKLTGNRSQPLLVLARMVAAWGWENESVELLWTVAKNQDARAGALQELYQHYAGRGDTPGLHRVLTRSLEIVPDDATMQNNFAQISLLIGMDTERARRLAAELVRKAPKNPAYVATYAYSIYTEGDIEDAIATMQKLSEADRELPAIAAYYGAMLAAAGEKEKARPYLSRGRQAFLLPEEKAMLEKAEALSR